MVFLDLQIRTAAGPVNVHNVKCYVLEEGDDQFMLGRDVLEALGINVKSALKHLANTSIELNRDDLPNEPKVGDLIDEKVNVELKWMCDEITVQTSDETQRDFNAKLLDIHNSCKRLWRTKVGPDEPALV
ncbi:uncharacterized protein PHALS_04869 [Plasmopara halstedii]|uniref:Uncharacterized protein n=1 Tax=Plasmopara halstedii TaxID=4781 RepID=A0A0P1AZB2_PLAHL|nr:uncharacterized protein PHALS_04869 [Plasmopara halstedii]CEG47725.1 hypothetical protein PHALS_04869 [Plasmopara halstedii]|eukprot:XP_024584094.1 hypothetical protein PHALS_04869 [Plasmopara halstedii]